MWLGLGFGLGLGLEWAIVPSGMVRENCCCRSACTRSILTWLGRGLGLGLATLTLSLTLTLTLTLHALPRDLLDRV